MQGLELSIGKARVSKKLQAMASMCQAEVAATMADEATRIVSEMQAVVPKRTHELEKSIGWTFGDPPKDAKFVAQGRRTKIAGQFLRISIYAGSFVAYWARWVEFGTKARAPGVYRDEKNKRRNAGKRGHAATPAQPYFWPIWRANQNHVRTAIRNAMKRAIKNVARIN